MIADNLARFSICQPETRSDPRPCSLGSYKPPFWTIRQTMTPASLGGFLMSIAWGK